MKTITKKCGVYATCAAVLLVMAALVTGCPAPESSGYKPPVGMGAVQLNFDKNIARATILPDTVVIGDFDQFILTFTAAGGGAVTPAPIKRLNTSAAVRNATVTLTPGTYDLSVVAYLEEDVDESAAAVWSSPAGTPLNITAGNTVSENIILKPYDPLTDSGNGTFAWQIHNNINGTLATDSEMTLTTLAGGAAGGDWIDLDLTDNDSFENTIGVFVFSNYYYINIVLKVNGVMRNFRHVLHIY